MISKKGFTLALCVAFMFVSLSIAMPSYGESILNNIGETGKVNMGFREGSVPFGFMNQKGKWVGFGLDLGEEIVKALGQKFGKNIKLVKKPINPKTRIPLVINGTVDIGIGSTTITLAREEVVDFSLPYFLTGTRILVPKESPIKDFRDLAGKILDSFDIFCLS